MTIVETIVEKWKEQDPYLQRPDEFQRFFDQEYPKEQKKAEKEAERRVKLIVRVFTAPTIVWKGAWMDSIPKWLLDHIKVDRLMALIKGEWDGEATDAEALTYMMPRTREMPLDHDWVQIYCYLATQVMQQAKGVEVPTEVAVEKLTDYQMNHLLKPLKRWIWRKQTEALRERRKKNRQSINLEKTV